MCEDLYESNKLNFLEEKYNCTLTKDFDKDNHSLSLVVTFAFETKIQLLLLDGEKPDISPEIVSTNLDKDTYENLKREMIKRLRFNKYQNYFFQIETICQAVQSFLKTFTKSQLEEATTDASNFSSLSNTSSSNKGVLAATFSKPIKASKSKQPSQGIFKKSSKKPAMKTAHDVINRIKWDQQLKASDFVVGYEDRFIGIIERQFDEFDWDNDIAAVGPDILAIPQHRIQYFKYNNKVVWEKDSRLDDFFGSTGSGNTIHNIIKESSQHEPNQMKHHKETNTMLMSSTSAETGNSEIHSSPIKKKQRFTPNYFICVKINQQHISQNLQKCIQLLAKQFRHEYDRELFLDHVVSFEKLHVTLCVCSITDDSDIAKIQQVLDEMYVNAEQLMLNIVGLGEFNRTVLFGKIQSRSLRSLQSRLVEALKEKNINLNGNYPNYIPHLTLAQFHPRQKHLFNTISPFYFSKKMQKWRFTNSPIVIDTISLCKMKSTGEDKFYKVYGSSTIKVQTDCYHNEPERFRYGSRKQQPPHGKDRSSKQSNSDFYLSRTLTAILRHNKYGFKIDSEGYVKLESILKHQIFKDVEKERIYRIVETNNKQRFTITTINDVELIKANQGHSVQVESLDLTEIIDPSAFPTVVHGTFVNAWNSIRKNGLHRRKRIHIHMTTAEPSHDSHVISGMRKSCNVFIYINIADAMQDGLRFFVSSNGVILSPGDENGFISPKYFNQVIGVKGKKRCNLLDEAEQGCFEQEEVAVHLDESEVENSEDDIKSVLDEIINQLENLHLDQHSDSETMNEDN